MKIFCMSAIHGCLPEFEQALSLVDEEQDDRNRKLVYTSL